MVVLWKNYFVKKNYFVQYIGKYYVIQLKK